MRGILKLSDKKSMVQTTPTNAQLYTLPTLALLVSIIALILIVLAEINTANLPGFTSVASQNGFQGLVTGHTAQLSTSVSGLLYGTEAGGLEQANDNEITMQDFDADAMSAASENISSTDTVLQGVQRGCVLNQTKLGTNFTPILSRVQTSDTLLTCFRKAQGIVTSRQNIFSVVTPRTSPFGSASIWDLPISGSTSLPAGFWKPGTAIHIDSNFTWYTQDEENLIAFDFKFNNQTVSRVLGCPVVTINDVLLSIVLVAESTTSVKVYMTLSVNFGPSYFYPQYSSSISQSLTNDINVATNLTLFHPTVHTSGSVVLEFASGTLLYQS